MIERYVGTYLIKKPSLVCALVCQRSLSVHGKREKRSEANPLVGSAAGSSQELEFGPVGPISSSKEKKITFI